MSAASVVESLDESPSLFVAFHLILLSISFSHSNLFYVDYEQFFEKELKEKRRKRQESIDQKQRHEQTMRRSMSERELQPAIHVSKIQKHKTATPSKSIALEIV